MRSTCWNDVRHAFTTPDGVAGRVHPDDDHPGAPAGPGGRYRAGGEPGGGTPAAGVSAAPPDAAITGAADGVLAVAASAFSPRTANSRPAIFAFRHHRPNTSYL